MLGGALKACRASTSLDLPSFARELHARGFRAARTPDAKSLAAALKRLEDSNDCPFTDAELLQLRRRLEEWLKTPDQQAALTALAQHIALRILRHTHLPTQTDPPLDDDDDDDDDPPDDP